MPRSNRPRGQRGGASDDDESSFELARALTAGLHTVTRRGRQWNVQPISAVAAVKTYACPGCSLGIDPGTPHVVTWRADGILGDQDALAGRRHWHHHCWRIAG
jgi:hypothetical protein